MYGDDADADPSNELQTLSFDSGSNELSLSNGNSITIPSGGTDADADPTNEYQDLSLSGTTLQISDGTGVDLSPIIPPGGTDDQTAAEVPYDNAVSGLTSTDAQAAIDELAAGGLVDTDDQNLILTGDVLTIQDGTGSINLGDYVNDADSDPTNEFQDISLSGTELSISNGSTIDLGPIVPPGGTDDQNLVLTGDVLSIENGTSTVDLNTYRDDADADPSNEVDVTAQSGILIGDGAIVSGLVGTADGQVAKWNAGTSSWIAGTDATSGGGGGSLWNEISTGISYNAGFVGIETNDPTAKLDVNGDIRSRALSGTGERNVVANASGNLIIGAGGGGSSLWNEDGASIFFDTGNVGIGLTTPSSLLHIHSTEFESNTQYTTTSTGLEGNDGLWVGMRNEVFSGPTGRIINLEDGPLNLGTNGLPYLTISNLGNVGVGTTAPTGKLHITKGYSASPFLLLETASGDRADVRFSKSGSTSSWDQIAGIRTDAASGTMSYYYNDGGSSNHILTLRGDHKVGVNTFNPQAAFDVDGNIRSSELVGAGQRNVMADANGNLVIGAGGGSSSLWTENGSDIHYDAGNVGIGVAAPQTKLDIQGGQWDLSATEGDFRIGSDIYRLNIGVSLDGGGAGTVRMRAKGGVKQLKIGAGDTDVITIKENAVEISGEVNQPSTGVANMLPLAYGRISETGAIETGSGNFTVSKLGSFSSYIISIAGETLTTATRFSIIATRLGSSGPGFISASYGNDGAGVGAAIIRTFGLDGTQEDTSFSFIVFRE